MSSWRTSPIGRETVGKLLPLVGCLLIFGLRAAPAQVKGRVERITFFSSALGIYKNMNVYLPPGYGAEHEYYPVVYLFRGHEREWVNREEDSSRRGRNIQDVADQLYAEGRIGKMILVMPGLASDDNTVPGLGVNFVQVSSAGGKAGIGTGRFEDFLVQDVIPYIDGHYRTIPSRTQRGVDGFSLGGYTAMMLITRHPELFCSAGSYDGTLMWLDLDDPRTPGTLDDQTWLGSSLFDPAFGRPRNVQVMLSYNPCNLVRDASEQRLVLLATCQFLIHSAGSEQAGNLRRAQHMVEVLRSRGLENQFQEIRLSPNAEHNWYFADEHMRVTLPLHWQKFQNPATNIPLRLVLPAPGDRVHGQTVVMWSPGRPLHGGLTLVSFSRDNGTHWQSLLAMSSADTSFLWNTAEVPDGTRYRLRVMVVADSLVGLAETPGKFTVDNPGNGAPDLVVWGPAEGEVISGTKLIAWSAEDADGDLLLVSGAYSSDDGRHWYPLFERRSGNEAFQWQTTAYENSTRYRLLVSCFDGTVTVTDTSSLFAVENERTELSPGAVRHVAGNGSGSVAVHVVSHEDVRDALYRVTFQERPTRYDVWRVGDGVQLVGGATQVDGTCEGPLFDGLRLVVSDLPAPEVNEDSTGWVVGASTLRYRVYLPVVDLGTEVLSGVPWPADYEIAVCDELVALSSDLWGAEPLPTMFWVREVITDSPVEFIYNDPDADATISAGDELFLIAREAEGRPQLTWAITFAGLPRDEPPRPGDVFVLKTKKPFTSRDVFEFNPFWNGTAVEDNGVQVAEFAVSAYPNPFNDSVVILCAGYVGGPLRAGVFDLRGRKVRQIDIEGSAQRGHAITWDGTDSRGYRVPSGVYLIRVRAGPSVSTTKVVLAR